MKDMINLVDYKDATDKENILGRSITIFDDSLRVVTKKRNKSFSVEPILSLRGSYSSLDDYADSLSSKSRLMYQLTSSEEKFFDKARIVTLKKEGKTFKKVTPLESELSLLDSSFKSMFSGKEELVRVTGSLEKARSYDIEKISLLKESQENLEKILLGKKRLGSGLYIEVKPEEVPEEYQNYISTFVSDKMGSYILVSNHLFLLDLSDTDKWDELSKKQYDYLLTYSMPVGILRTGENIFGIHRYNSATKKLLKKGSFQYAAEVPEIKVLELFREEKVSPLVLDNLREAYKTEKGYEISSPFKEKDKEIF